MISTIAPPLSTSDAKPHDLIWTLSNAYVPAACLTLAAELGVADQIDEEQPTALETLAERHGVDPDALDRVLSLLAAHGIFARQGRAYAHTPASRLLRSDHPRSARAFPRMNGLPFVWQTFAHLDHSIRTGKPAIEMVDPGGLWAYLRDRPDEAQIFMQAMSAKALGDVPAILDRYDFQRFERIADVGGGRGHLLAAILESAPASHGILFDLPAVIESLDIQHERLTPWPGDFFVGPLPAADCYVLMEILHDWPDEQCIAILRSLRAACPSGAKLLVIEDILSERGRDAQGHNLDVLMLAVTGGRERTPGEFDELFNQTGFGPSRVIETDSRLRLVETTAR